jgi:hypothetical protein
MVKFASILVDQITFSVIIIISVFACCKNITKKLDIESEN